MPTLDIENDTKKFRVSVNKEHGLNDRCYIRPKSCVWSTVFSSNFHMKIRTEFSLEENGPRNHTINDYLSYCQEIGVLPMEMYL